MVVSGNSKNAGTGSTAGGIPLRIIARTNGVGIDRDVALLTEAFATFRDPPEFSRYRDISPLRRLAGRRRPGCILFLERITARWLRQADRFLLIPNQERYPARLIGMLRHVDHILCKSEHARAIFARLHPSTHYIGFTSVDRQIAGVAPDYGRFLHLAGGSSLKGTEALVEVWSRHAEWPELTIVRHAKHPLGPLPPNVRLIERYLPDEELRLLQNTCGIHVCPSLSEGWGHYIVEGMSCRAVVVATDGPPMNELVGPERGVLVPYERTKPRKLGINYHVDRDALEKAIQRLIDQPVEEKAGIGAAARAWFEDNDRAFRHRLRSVVSAIMPELMTDPARPARREGLDSPRLIGSN